MSIGMRNPETHTLGDMNMEPWAQRIQRRMTELGLKQTDLARACGLKDSSISGWFGKASKPTRMIGGDNLVAVARYLRTTPEWIITGKGSPDAQPSHSQSARLDARTFHIVARAMQDAYDELGIALNIKDRADLFMDMYERATSGELTTGDVVWLGTRLAAALPPGGQANHGRRNDVSSDQGGDQGTGKSRAKG